MSLTLLFYRVCRFRIRLQGLGAEVRNGLGFIGFGLIGFAFRKSASEWDALWTRNGAKEYRYVRMSVSLLFRVSFLWRCHVVP